MNQTVSGSTELQRRFRDFSREDTFHLILQTEAVDNRCASKSWQFLKELRWKIKSLTTQHTASRNLLPLDWPRLFSVFPELLLSNLHRRWSAWASKEGREPGWAPAQSTILLYFFPEELSLVTNKNPTRPSPSFSSAFIPVLWGGQPWVNWWCPAGCWLLNVLLDFAAVPGCWLWGPRILGLTGLQMSDHGSNLCMRTQKSNGYFWWQWYGAVSGYNWTKVDLCSHLLPEVSVQALRGSTRYRLLGTGMLREWGLGIDSIDRTGENQYIEKGRGKRQAPEASLKAPLWRDLCSLLLH